MKLKKKFNYYNLFVYGFKFWAMAAFVAVFFLWIANIKSSDFWQGFFLILYLLFCFFMVVCIHFAQKYEKKITTYIEKPKKPKTYKVKAIKSIDLEQKLIEMNYEKISDILENKNIYYYEKRSIWLGADHNPQKNVFAFFSFEEYTKENQKFIIKEKQKITRALKGKRGAFQIGFLITVKNNNEYLEKYLMERTPQGYRNYFLNAFYVEKDQNIYIPYCQWANSPYAKIRKRLLRLLNEYIEKH